MLGAIKVIGTVLAATAAANVGKQQYEKYRDAKRKRQVEEVHRFLSGINLDHLQKAIKSEDVEVLVDAVESIIGAANTAREKTNFEALQEDISEATKDATDSMKTFFEGLTASEDFKKASEAFTKGVDKVTITVDTWMESTKKGLETTIGEIEAEIEKEKLRKEEEQRIKEEEATRPTFAEFMNSGKPLTVYFDNGCTKRTVTFDSEGILINPSKKIVRVSHPEDSNIARSVVLQ